MNKCAPGLVAPQPAHLIVLINLLRYIKHTTSWCVAYSNSSSASIMLNQMSVHLQDIDWRKGLSVVCMSDVDHASSFDNPRFRSLPGNTGLVYGNLVYWSTSVIPRRLGTSWRTTNLPTTYDVDSRVMPMPIRMDNVSAIQLANHPKSTQFSSHIAMHEFRIRYAYMRGRVHSTDILPSILQPLRIIHQA